MVKASILIRVLLPKGLACLITFTALLDEFGLTFGGDWKDIA